MCRLFGLHAGRTAATATFWLLDAPDNLSEQSRRNPDGTGVGVFGPDGNPVLRKQPMAAWKDAEFATEARELTGTTFLAHVRYATTGAIDVRNTHPFLQDGRLFAHNGTVEGIDLLDARIADLGVSELVAGQSDSERVGAIIAGEIRSAGGDVGTGLRNGLRWLAAEVPIFALNILLCTATDFWALRCPDTHELYLLDRSDPARHSRFDMRSSRIRAHSDDLNSVASVLLASEPMDTDPGWTELAPGELVHVDADLRITRELLLPDPPRHRLRIADLSGAAADAQRAN